MNVHAKIPSDIIGLTTPSPLSRRGFFMTASAAAAAGYTLAAGPVRAQVVTTDTDGPQGRRRHGEGHRRRHAGLFRAAREGQEPAGHPGRDGDLRPARIHQGRDAAPRQGRRLRHRAGLLFPLGRGSHQDHRDAEADADRERQAGRRAVRRSRRHRGLGEVAGRQHRPARHHRLLPRRPHRVGICGHNKNLKAGVAFYGSLVDPPAQKAQVAEEPDRARAGDEGAGARPLRRRGPGHSGRAGRGDEGGARQGRRRRPSSRSIPARRTASTPTTGRATARRRPRTPGSRRSPGSRRTRC